MFTFSFQVPDGRPSAVHRRRRLHGGTTPTVDIVHGSDGCDGAPMPPHDEAYFASLLASARADLTPRLSRLLVPPALRRAFRSCCSAAVAARAARDAAATAKDAADKAAAAAAPEDDDAAKKAAQDALDAANVALDTADTAVTDCARPILTALGDGLMKTDSLDPILTTGAVLFNGTPRGLADFCAAGEEEDGLVMGLLDDVAMMRRMLEAGGAKGGEYGPAAQMYDRIKQEGAREWVHVDVAGDDGDDGCGDDNDNDDDDDVLDRLALGTALEHAVPVSEFRSDSTFIDPVARYRHYAAAHGTGELDETFSDRSAFEMRLVTNCDAPDEQLAWCRSMLRTYRPDLVRLEDTKWRYCNIVHTDVNYCHPPFDETTYQKIIDGGGECGPRAWFGRYACRAFGIPVWGCKQPGHAAMTHWTPDEGWVVCLIYGGLWEIAWWEDRCGDDFLLETRARESGKDQYMSVLRLEWVADVLGEKELDHMKVAVDPDCFWRSLALCQKKILADGSGKPAAPIPDRSSQAKESIPPQILPSSRHFENKHRQAIYPTRDGTTIVVPATSCTKPAAPGTSNVLFMDSFPSSSSGGGDGGTQLHHREDAIVEYILDDVPAAGKYGVTFRVCNVHSTEVAAAVPLLLTVCPVDSDHATVVAIAVPYTVGAWASTEVAIVELVAGANTVSFTRETPNTGLSIQEFRFSTV